MFLKRFVLIAAAVITIPAFGCNGLLNADFRPLAGEREVNLCDQFEGKVLLIVNTASKCGFTPQYEALEKLHAKYAQQGFSVVGFPSNDFRDQEPGTEAEIKEFCTLTYGVKFPMFEKVHVKEGEANAFYQKLAEASGGHFPSWNFYKYIINRNGDVVGNFSSNVTPEDPKLIAQIEKLLAEKPAAKAQAKK